MNTDIKEPLPRKTDVILFAMSKITDRYPNLKEPHVTLI